MDPVPQMFRESVCRLLSQNDLSTLSSLKIPFWTSSSTYTLSKIVPIDVIITQNKDFSGFNCIFKTYTGVPLPSFEFLRLHQFAIKGYEEEDLKFRSTPLKGGFQGSLFLHLLHLACIECRLFSIQRIDPNLIDLTRFKPHHLVQLLIYPNHFIVPDSKLVNWLRTSNFPCLHRLSIQNAPACTPLDLKLEMSVLIASSQLESLESVSDVGISFFLISEEFVMAAWDAWSHYPHKVNRSCQICQDYRPIWNLPKRSVYLAEGRRITANLSFSPGIVELSAIVDCT